MSRKRKRSKPARSMSKMLKSHRRDLSPGERHDVDTLFGKKFQYADFVVSREGAESGSPDVDVTVEEVIGEKPSFCEEIWQDEKLMELKCELNQVKDQLSVQDIETWHSHTTKCNLAGRIIPYVKSLDVELCTQAWVKFYEIVTTHRRLVPEQNFFSLHLCEAPGAFVASLNHFLQLQGFSHDWDWRATTLNPYLEANSTDAMIADDRLIRQTYPKWYFGKDGSGDIMKEGHVQGLLRMMADLSSPKMPVLLVTADGSKDCQSNPAEQEALLSKLHYCEVLTACLVLAPRGCLVIKMFTMLESSSLVLSFLLNVMFEEVHIIKPATSKSGNSEVYLACLGYKANVKESTLKGLLHTLVYSSEHPLLSVPELPPLFVDNHRLCCRKFAEWQIQTIQRNVELFTTMDSEKSDRLVTLQDHALKTFIERTGVVNSRHLMKVGVTHKQIPAFQIKTCFSGHLQSAPPIWPHKRLKGTFELRQNIGHMTFSERVKLMRAHHSLRPNVALVSRFSLEDEMGGAQWSEPEMAAWSSEVNNSRFCDVDIMHDYMTIFSDSQFQTCRQSALPQHCTALVKTLEDIVLAMVQLEPRFSALPYDKDTAKSGDKRPRDKQLPVLYFYHGAESSKHSEELRTFVDQSSSSGAINLELVTDLCKAVSESNKNRCVQIFCDVTTFFTSGSDVTGQGRTLEEVRTRRTFLSKILYILKNIRIGSRLILLTSTFLTRLSAGYLYVLARCFKETSIRSEPNLWLHQFLVLDDFCGFGPLLCRKLEKLEALLEQEEQCEERHAEQCLMGIVNTPYLLSDRKFIQFVTQHNNFAVANFVDLMLAHYQENSPCTQSLESPSPSTDTQKSS